MHSDAFGDEHRGALEELPLKTFESKGFRLQSTVPPAGLAKRDVRWCMNWAI